MTDWPGTVWSTSLSFGARRWVAGGSGGSGGGLPG